MSPTLFYAEDIVTTQGSDSHMCGGVTPAWIQCDVCGGKVRDLCAHQERATST